METLIREVREAEKSPVYDTRSHSVFTSIPRSKQNLIWVGWLTKISVASHSLFHLSVVFLSSSPDRSRYILNKASDLSTDFGCTDGSSDLPGSGAFGGETGVFV